MLHGAETSATMMWLEVQLSAIWLGIHLVGLVASLQSTCEVKKFSESRSQDGDVQCAMAPAPSATVVTNTKMKCSHECARRSVKCAAGFNYKCLETLCEMFTSPPSSFQVHEGCEYYAVCIRLSISYTSLFFIIYCDLSGFEELRLHAVAAVCTKSTNLLNLFFIEVRLC